MLSFWKNNSGTTVGVSSTAVTQEKLKPNRWLQVVTLNVSSLAAEVTPSSSILFASFKNNSGFVAVCVPACFCHFLIPSHSSEKQPLTFLSISVEPAFTQTLNIPQIRDYKHRTVRCLLTGGKTVSVPLSTAAVWLFFPPFSTLVK